MLSHRSAYEVLDGGDDFVGTDVFDDDDFLEEIERLVIGLREGFFLGGGAVEDVFPFIGVGEEVFVDVEEVGELSGPVELAVEIGPLVIRDPGGGIVGDSYFS